MPRLSDKTRARAGHAALWSMAVMGGQQRKPRLSSRLSSNAQESGAQTASDLSGSEGLLTTDAAENATRSNTADYRYKL